MQPYKPWRGWKKPVSAWSTASSGDELVALVAQRLLEAYRRLSRLPEGVALLGAYLERYPSLDLLDVVYQLVLESEGNEAAYRMVRTELQRNPTLLGLEKLMSARLPLASNEVRGDVELAKTCSPTTWSRASVIPRLSRLHRTPW